MTADFQRDGSPAARVEGLGSFKAPSATCWWGWVEEEAAGGGSSTCGGAAVQRSLTAREFWWRIGDEERLVSYARARCS